MLLGTYEKAATPWSPKATPWDFGQDLLPPDLDRIAPSLEVGFKHFPALQQRRHPQDRQRALHLLARRQSAGRAGAGPEEFLVRLRRHGGLQPGRRRRPGALATGWWTAIRASTSGPWTSRASARGRRSATPTPRCARIYSRRFRIRFPNEELPAARPMQTTPLYDKMIAQGAVMGDSAGGSRRRSGSRRRASSRRTSSPSTAPTISRM